MRGYQQGFFNLSERVRDPHSRQRQAEKLRRILQRHAGRSLIGARCLDLGCSSGIIAAALADLFRQTVGVDYDEIALRHIAVDDKRVVSFVRGDGMNLPFPDGCFDVVVCAQVYEHVPDDRRLFQELYRILADGGVVLFSGPNWLFPIEPHYFLPFLHWLPASLADAYLRLFHMGNHYYERSRTYWGLKRLLGRFEICDASVEALKFQLESRSSPGAGILQRVPSFFWETLVPLYPNFNWLLTKPRQD